MGKIKTLNEMKMKTYARVIELRGEGELRRRIIDMGITPGVIIYLRKAAPLGDPLQIRVRGYELSIRRAQAENIYVQAEYS